MSLVSCSILTESLCFPMLTLSSHVVPSLQRYGDNCVKSHSLTVHEDSALHLEVLWEFEMPTACQWAPEGAVGCRKDQGSQRYSRQALDPANPRPTPQTYQQMVSSCLLNLEEAAVVLLQLRNCFGKCWFLLVLLPAPTLGAGLHQSRPLLTSSVLQHSGPACPTPVYVSQCCKVRSLELLWKSTPSCIFSKDVKINFLKRIQGKASVVFVYRLLLWDLLDILQGFQSCTSSKYLFLVI